jgi:integrase
MSSIKAKRNKEGTTPHSRRVPTLAEYVERYLSWLEQTGGKTRHTIRCKRSSLNAWVSEYGALRLNQITAKLVSDFVLKRKTEDKVGNRTVNLDVQYLGSLLARAKAEGLIHPVALEGWEPLKYRAPKRNLMKQAELDKFLAECALTKMVYDQAVPKYQNGEMLADYVRFMCFSGARKTSALATRWSDVDWDNRHVTLSDTKYGNHIVVDFNDKLEGLLKEMLSLRQPDSDFLFPALDGEGHVLSLVKSFELVRENAGLPHFRLHDSRHYFISFCVMSGVDFMTVAKWAGHSDGGLQVGKVYGHLNKEHTGRQAAKVKFSHEKNEEPSVSETNPALLDLTKISAAQLLQAVALLQAKQKPVIEVTAAEVETEPKLITAG